MARIETIPQSKRGLFADVEKQGVIAAFFVFGNVSSTDEGFHLLFG